MFSFSEFPVGVETCGILGNLFKIAFNSSFFKVSNSFNELISFLISSTLSNSFLDSLLSFLSLPIIFDKVFLSASKF